MSRYFTRELVVYVLWFIFGILYFDRHSAQFDELLMLDILLNTEVESLLYVLTSVEIQMPFNYFVSHWLSEVFSPQLWLMRLPSLLFTLLTPIPMYFWAKEKLGDDAAPFVPLLWMFSYPTIYYFYSIRPYSALVFFFVCFMYFIESERYPGEVKKKAIILIGLLLFLTHPLGPLIVTLSFLWLVLSSSYYRTQPLVITLFLFLLCMSCLLFIGRTVDFLTMVSTQEGKSSLVVLQESIGFLFSGLPFAFLYLFVTIFSLALNRRREYMFRGYGFFIFVCILTVFMTLQVFSSFPIGPRHFIILLPYLILVFTGLTFRLISEQRVAKSILYIGFLCLSYKSFVTEDLLHKPPNLNSAEVSLKVFDYSAFGEVVVSCGNCPSYYIRDERLICLAAMNELDLERFEKYFVLIDFKHKGEQCSSDALNAEYTVLKKFETEGATVKYYVKR